MSSPSDFARFLLSRGALKVAPDESRFFKLKSGRLSPVFANMGSLIDGEALAVLAEAYADRMARLLKSGALEDFDFLFGPAYKGIPLAALACEALWRQHQIRKKFLYDRKEAKAHGDLKADALIVGADQFRPGQKLLMIDDVISSGGAKIEAYAKLKALGDFKLVGVLVAIDRQECAGDAKQALPSSAADEMKTQLGCPLFSIASMGDLYSALSPSLSPSVSSSWRAYFKKWGTPEARKWAGRA